MDKILEVKKLKISFRTPGGTLKAVRDISFDLERGKTLAIVGESGSGKSVTSKAILGILAGNSIIEGGEILYDGKDLLTIPESEMYHIRGDKISMIFQDPLSSLNSIVKIGKQITEAMILKNKANRKTAKADFNALLGILKANMIGADTPADKAEAIIETFDKFNIEGLRMENGYNTDFETAEALKADVADLLFRVSKKQRVDIKSKIKDFGKRLDKLTDPFFVSGFATELEALKGKVKSAYDNYVKVKEIRTELPEEADAALESLVELLEKMTAQTRPDFFSIGYYKLKKPGEDLSKLDNETSNEKARSFLEADFLEEFTNLEIAALRHSFEVALAEKKNVITKLEAAKTYFAGDLVKKDALKYCAELSDAVEKSIDRMETVKDSMAYTFRIGLVNAIEKYFYYQVKNPKEEARFERQSQKREALIARGKTVDWKVVPKATCDLEDLKANMIALISRLEERYKMLVASADSVDFAARANELTAYFQNKASQVVYRVTKAMAKEKAIKLMEEVGIPEPRIRYYQYPFEFSGGMRQRIVIAIALSANPDILICDEPTTALDVTIQAQILELINKLKAERNLSVIFITHDLGVVANMADEIAVMYAGKIVEYGTAEEVFYDPKHPYTWALLSSMPDLDTSEKLDAIPGTPPNMIYPPVGDAFADRNKYALKIDFEEQPPMFEVSPTHRAATWLLHPNAPKVEVPKIITDRIDRMMKKAGGESHGEQ